MKRRSILLVSLFALLAFAWFAPQHPAGRSWLLGQAQTVLAQRGLQLSFTQSAGNPWRGVTLRGVRLTGEDIDVGLEHLRLSYALPYLVLGELPLSVTARGVRGNLDVNALRALFSGGQAPPIRPVLGDIVVDEVGLELSDLPYTLPDLRVDTPQLSGRSGELQGPLALTTTDGTLNTNVDLQTSPFALFVRVDASDVTIARHWWRGIEAGTVTGTLYVVGPDGDLGGQLDLEDGVVETLGLTVDNISGPFVLARSGVTATLQGDTLGDTVYADAALDWFEREYRGTLTGTLDIATTVSNFVPDTLIPTDATSGSLAVEADVRGWRTFTVVAEGTGNGQVAGETVDGIEIDATYDSASGPSRGLSVVAASDTGDLTVRFRPGTEIAAGRLEVTADDLDLAVLRADGSLDLTLGEQLRGDADLNLAGTLFGRDLDVQLRAETLPGSGRADSLSGNDLPDDNLSDDSDDNAGVWQATVRGSSTRDETVQGTIRLGSNLLDADLRLDNLDLPGLTERSALTLSADGPLDNLPLTLTLDPPVSLRIGSVTIAEDFGGTLSATLQGTRLSGIDGRLGPLEVRGDIDVTEQTGEVAFELAPSTLGGPLDTTLGLNGGLWQLGPQTIRTTLVTDALSIDTLTLFGIDAATVIDYSDGFGAGLDILLRDPSSGLLVIYEGGELSVGFDETTVNLADQTVTLSGTAQISLEAPLEASTFNLSVRTGGVRAQLQGTPQDFGLGVGEESGGEEPGNGEPDGGGSDGGGLGNGGFGGGPSTRTMTPVGAARGSLETLLLEETSLLETSLEALILPLSVWTGGVSAQLQETPQDAEPRSDDGASGDGESDRTEPDAGDAEDVDVDEVGLEPDGIDPDSVEPGSDVEPDSDNPNGIDLGGISIEGLNIEELGLDPADLDARFDLVGGITSLSPLTIEAGFASSPERLEIQQVSDGFQVRGDLPIAPLADAFEVGVDLTGQLRADLTIDQTPDGLRYDGTVRVDGVVADYPLGITFRGDGPRVTVEAESRVLNQNIGVTGTVQPNLELRASIGDLGTLRFADGRVTGSGQTPALRFGSVIIDALPWQFDAAVPTGGATLHVGTDEAGGPGLNLAGRRVVPRLELTLNRLAPDAPLNGQLSLRTDGARTSLAVSGTPLAPTLSGTIPRTFLAAVADPLGVVLADDVGLQASFDLQDGVRVRATLDSALGTEATPLRIDISGTPDDLTARLQADGLSAEARVQNGTLSGQVSADNLDLVTLVPDFGVAATLDGTLRYDGGAAWQGELDATVRAPYPVSLRVRGAGERLAVTASTAFRGAEVGLELTLNRLAPNANLNGQLSLRTNGAQTNLVITGTLLAPTLTGTIPRTLLATVADPLGVILADDVSLQASFNVQDGVQIRATLDSAIGSETMPTPLRIDISGTPNDLIARLQADGLSAEARVQNGTLRGQVSADNLDLITLAPEVVTDFGVAATLDGTLRYDDGAAWQGELGATVYAPYPVSLRVRGEGEQLTVTALNERGPVAVDVRGTVLPNLALTAAATVEGVARFEGSFEDDVLTGTLQTETLTVDGVTSPAQTVQLRAGLEPPQLTLSGDALTLRLTENELAGTVAWPVLLYGEPHLVNADISGTLDAPRVDGDVAGPFVSGPFGATRRAVESTLRVDLPQFPDGLEPVEVALDVDIGVGLSATNRPSTATVTASTVFRGEEVGLELTLFGSPADYRTDATLQLGPARLALSAQGDTSNLDATAVLAPFDLGLVSDTVSGTATATATLRFSGGALRYNARLNADGTLGGQPFDLTLTSDSATSLLLSGNVAGRSIAFDMIVTQTTQTRQHWANTTTTQEVVRLQIDGAVDAAAVDADIAVALDTLATEATVRVGEQRLGVQVALEDAGINVRATAQSPQVDGPVTLTATVVTGAGGVGLEPLTLSTPYGQAELRGVVGAVVALNGTVRTPFVDQDITLSFRRDDGYQLNLTGLGLTLSAQTDPDLAPVRVTSEGTLNAELPLVQSLRAQSLQSTLEWSRAAGFRGAASGVVGVSESVRVDVRAEADGTGNLDLSLLPEQQGETLATVQLVLPASASLESVGLRVSRDGLPLQLTGDLGVSRGVSGSLTDPVVRGDVALSGEIAATGTLVATREGLELLLSGNQNSDRFDLDVRVDARRVRVLLGADNLALDGLLPYLAEPRVSGRVVATQTWGAGLSLVTEELTLNTPGGRVEGYGRLEPSPFASLSIDLPVADLNLPIDVPIDLANTRVRGGLTLGRSSVAAPLENAVLGGSLFVDTFAVAGQPLSAEITLAGDVSEPRADVTLRGQGTATGALTATLTPDAVRLQSDLRLAEVTSDVDLTLTRQQLGGAGEVRWRDYRVTFVSEEERQLQLVGADALAGWRGVIDLGAVNLGATDGSDGGRLSLSGDLASLDGPLAGRVRLEVVPNDEVWLEATLQDVRVAGRALGDVTVRGQNEATGRTLAVTGDVVAARAELTPEFRWALAGLELPLTDTLTLNATGSGTLTSGAVDAVVGGTLGGGVGELELPVSARYQGAALALDIEDGALLGGTVRGALRFDDGWSGTVDVSGASLVGGELGLNTTLAGPLARPELRADSRFRLGAYALSGQVTASRSRLQFEQTLDAPSLAGPVAISGEVWPGLELTLQQGDDTLTVRNGGSLQAFGTLALDLGPARLRLGAGTGDTLLVGEVSSPRLPGLVLNAQLPRNLAQLRDGLSITTGETARGTIRLLPGGGASVTAFRWDGPYGPVTVDGELRQNGVGLVGQLTGRWRPDARSTSPLSVLTPLSLDLALTPNTATLVSQSEAGALRFALDRGSGDAEAFGSLSVGAGRLELDVRYRPDTGPQGRLELRDIPLQLTDNAPTLDSEVFFDPDELRGTLSLVTESGDARLATRLGWRRLLPAALHDAVPQGSTIRFVSGQLSELDLSALPLLERRTPFLSAPVSGRFQLNDRQLSGRLSSAQLAVVDITLPSALSFNGTLGDFAIGGNLGDSRIDLGVRDGVLAGLVVLERFPLDLAAEAVLGSSAVEASVTGRVRLELPLNNPLAGRIDVATERLLLQRGSRASEGDVALVYADRTLNVERAIFRGPGVWQAEGTLGQQGLNFRLDARNADFGPLLGLVPQFAALDLGAQGSLSLTAGGNLSSPTVALDSPALDVSLGETRYTLRALQVRLAGDDLSASADLIASGAASGTLALRGSGQLDLSPYQVGDLQIRVDGGLELPTIGQLGDLRARIFADTPGNWQLDASGSLGTPFTLRGRLNPLDLRLSGDDLALQAPRLFVASSSSDVDLRLRSQLGQFLISGAVRADQAELALAEAEESPEESEPNPLFTRIRFDNVAIVAPQQVLFRENFGNAEVALDLLLGGSVAAPTLQGSAQILRGTLRFSGQGFDVTSGVARFETSRGVFPAFEVRAVTRFQKRRVLNPRTNDIEFVEPRRSEDFEVFLDISGEFVPQEDASNRLELSTRLSSDARIQPPAQSTARPLRQPELLSLITVGRLELTPSIAGRGGLAGSVAEGAVDTAVDLYFLGELQQAIGDALGVEVFEIETSSVSALLGGSALFGLSLRVGGYLSDDVFASFRVGSFDDPAQRFAFSNEVTLRYELDPLEFVLSGGVNFFEDAALAPAPELNAALNYSITARTDVEAGLELSNEAQALRFGLTVRW